MKNNIIKADALIRKLEYDRDHSDRDLWDNKKSMEQWANHFIKLNVEKEENFENVFEDCEDKVESSNTDILKERLIEFRKQRSKEKNIPAYYVFNNNELERILEILPKTYEDLKKSKILTDVKINSHGKDIVNIINQVQ